MTAVSSAAVQSGSVPRVIIVGAGFAGLALAKKLAGGAYDVLLLDKQNHHTFQPLLYQVATAGLGPDAVSYPVRRSLRGLKGVRFQMLEVTGVDTEHKRVLTSEGERKYDYLVLATGSTATFFNFTPKSDQLLPLKSTIDAINIRSYILQNLEEAARTSDPALREELMNVAIIGGGPTGTELAGALGEMKRHVIPKDFPHLDVSQMSITLFEASDKLLGSMSTNASKHCYRYLEALGINIRVGSMVSDYESNRLILADGTTFPARSVVWTAGVKANPVPGFGDILLKGDRFEIDEHFRVKGLTDVFALGDVAACISKAEPRGLPMLAAVAMDQANWFGKHFSAIVRHQESVKPYEYKSKGVMATIGRNRAVVDLPHWQFSGPLAWFVWMFVHIQSLIGFRNKVVTMVDWLTNYFSQDRPLNAIYRIYERPEPAKTEEPNQAERKPVTLLVNKSSQA